MESRDFAKSLRRNLTDAEHVLWRRLRAYRLCGQKFRRQHPIGPYVVDFVHLGAKLVVEADGGQHLESASDSERDAWLADRGYRVMRFWNHQILREPEAVLEQILSALQVSSPSPPAPPPPGGRGEKNPRFED
ncbi:MAG: endonuclease domain-containing protein [Xanthomonadales bacterium]|nr:endonuclease domain-containing protein [Xanthomonadales bacterium]